MTTTPPMGLPHLRHVLAGAALGAGLDLAPVAQEIGSGARCVPDAQEARSAACAWGLDTERICPTVVVLVDGLGWECLSQRKGHAPTLRSWLAQCAGLPHGGMARTCVPSTTAAALTTLGTGALPGASGMVGYSVLNPVIDRPSRRGGVPTSGDNLCLITWEQVSGLSVPHPRQWQSIPTIFERLRPAGSTVTEQPLAVSVGPARFAGSGLTEAGLRGAKHMGADALEERPILAARALREGVPLVYLYVGELDHAGHGYGWRSAQWLGELERLDAAMLELVRRVPRGTRIILTADHGMIDTDAEHRITVTEHPELMRDVIALAGEPRFTQLYVPASDPDVASQVAQRWRDFLGERAAWVGTRDEARALVGPVSAQAHSVLGDVVVAMDGHWVVVDPRVHSPQAMAMPGVHGSVTDAECLIPLIVTAA